MPADRDDLDRLKGFSYIQYARYYNKYVNYMNQLLVGDDIKSNYIKMKNCLVCKKHHNAVLAIPEIADLWSRGRHCQFVKLPRVEKTLGSTRPTLGIADNASSIPVLIDVY